MTNKVTLIVERLISLNYLYTQHAILIIAVLFPK